MGVVVLSSTLRATGTLSPRRPSANPASSGSHDSARWMRLLSIPIPRVSRIAAIGGVGCGLSAGEVRLGWRVLYRIHFEWVTYGHLHVIDLRFRSSLSSTGRSIALQSCESSVDCRSLTYFAWATRSGARQQKK